MARWRREEREHAGGGDGGSEGGRRKVVERDALHDKGGKEEEEEETRSSHPKKVVRMKSKGTKPTNHCQSKNKKTKIPPQQSPSHANLASSSSSAPPPPSPPRLPPFLAPRATCSGQMQRRRWRGQKQGQSRLAWERRRWNRAKCPEGRPLLRWRLEEERGREKGRTKNEERKRRKNC